MSRTIAAAQKRDPDVYKSDTLAQTNNFFPRMAQKIHTKIFFQDLKAETNTLDTFFQIIYCSLTSHWKSSGKKVKLDLSKETFLSQENPDFGS